MDMDKLKRRLMLSYNIFKIVPLLGILIALYVMNRNLIAAYIIAIVCIAGGYGQALIFYRCPFCGARLMKVRGGVPRHCPECERQLIVDAEHPLENTDASKEENSRSQRKLTVFYCILALPRFFPFPL